MFNLQNIIAAVQTNCDIADARHAREMGMCNYLLAMSEFYRWEQQIPFAQPLKKNDLGAWISQREIKWNEIEENDYRSIPVDGCDHDHFDTTSINRALKKYDLVYGGGYGSRGKPHFFLAQLLRSETRSDIVILVSGREYARNMTAPPAALNRSTVFLRMDAMQRWLWEKIEIWGVCKTDGALKSALDCYGAEGDAETKLNIVAEHESETLILHELGEAMAEPLLGEAWGEMLLSFNSRRHELLARAVRDNLADCLSTLPELIARRETCSLHFYFANFDGLRQSLFPSLTEAYEHWRKNGDVVALQHATEAGCAHWQSVAQNLLAAWSNNPANAEIIIGSYGENFSGLML
jgi:hypothetical protein